MRQERRLGICQAGLLGRHEEFLVDVGTESHRREVGEAHLGGL